MIKLLTYTKTLAIVWIFLSYPVITEACTNLIITKGASSKGSTMITYSADSHVRYGYLFFYQRSQ